MRYTALVVASILAGCATSTEPHGGGHADAAAWPLDAEIVGALNQVSAARIESRVRTLAAFGTRHTLSETASDTHGIGAARRWIARELQSCSQAGGGRLQVKLDRHIEPADGRLARAVEIVNVVATLPGTAPAARTRYLVTSAHYDSRASDVLDDTSNAPGADDDASGVAAVMEMACVMASRHPENTLVFMAVAGEEQGLLGSTHWAMQARTQGLRIDAMLNNDIVGSPLGDAGQVNRNTVRLFADGVTPLLRQALVPPVTEGALEANMPGIENQRSRLDALLRAGGVADDPARQLGRYLKTIGERYLPGFEIDLIQRPDRYLRGGDHLPFLDRGYAAVRFTEPVENFAHQHQNVRVQCPLGSPADVPGCKGAIDYGDLPDLVDFGYVADVTRINLAGLATLAQAPAAPSNAQLDVRSLTNDTTLRWDLGNEPDLAGYRIVWRDTGSPVWQHGRDVGLVTQITLPGLSKDRLVFGVQAFDRAGHPSLASFPMPMRR